MIGQRRARLVLEAIPIAILRHGHAALVGHFQEQQVGELFDVIAVIHAMVTQRVAEAPEFLGDVGHDQYLSRIQTNHVIHPESLVSRFSLCAACSLCSAEHMQYASGLTNTTEHHVDEVAFCPSLKPLAMIQ